MGKAVATTTALRVSLELPFLLLYYYPSPHKHLLPLCTCILILPLLGVKTTQTLEGIEAQILQNKKDFPAAVQANQNAGAANLDEGAAAISGALFSTTIRLVR